MRIATLSKFSESHAEEWLEFYNKAASDRTGFTSEEHVGIVSPGQVLFTWEVSDRDALLKHGADPEVAAHIKRMDETSTIYEAREITEADGPGTYFGLWTFENETAQEWMDAWTSDEKRLTRDEVFGVVDDHSVLVLLTTHASQAEHDAHLQRPEIKEHIERINEQARVWRVEPAALD